MDAARRNYVRARIDLLERITSTLQNDERFVAAWLAGSFGRGEETWLSDLDLHLVVSDAASATLCAAPWQAGARTTEERFALFTQFGTPGIIFERASHANQIEGILTNVVYQESAQSVDWMLIPQAKASRERASLLLFDKVGLPVASAPQPESVEQRIERASTNVAFFWILACGGARALVAGRHLLYCSFLLELEQALQEVQTALQGERMTYTKHSALRMPVSYAEQVATLRRLCDAMERSMPQVVLLGGYVPAAPRAIVEMRLALPPDDSA